jgi:type II secretory ATPase GspE/PulE/Tfp pilus assembly ATPase PilB-like protein
VLCPACRCEQQLGDEVYARWTRLIGSEIPRRIFTSQGCTQCNNTGFQGRTGIFETVAANDDLRSILTDDMNEHTLRTQLRARGMRSMIHNGISKIEQGVTTPEELLRVVMADDLTT